MTRCRCCGTEIESNYTLCDACRRHPKRVMQGADPCPPEERPCAFSGCSDRRFDHKCICHYHTLIYRRVIWAKKNGRELTPDENKFVVEWNMIHARKESVRGRPHRKPKTPLERKTARQREEERKRKEEERKLHDIMIYLYNTGPSAAKHIPVHLVGRALALGEERGWVTYDGALWRLTLDGFIARYGDATARRLEAHGRGRIIDLWGAAP